MVEKGYYELERGKRTFCTTPLGRLLGNLLAGVKQQVIEHV